MVKGVGFMLAVGLVENVHRLETHKIPAMFGCLKHATHTMSSRQVGSGFCCCQVRESHKHFRWFSGWMLTPPGKKLLLIC